MTNREKLLQLPLNELLGMISDRQDECVICSLGHKDYFVLNDCSLTNDETISGHCRKCIAKWLDEEEE